MGLKDLVLSSKINTDNQQTLTLTEGQLFTECTSLIETAPYNYGPSLLFVLTEAGNGEFNK